MLSNLFELSFAALATMPLPRFVLFLLAGPFCIFYFYLLYSISVYIKQKDPKYFTSHSFIEILFSRKDRKILGKQIFHPFYKSDKVYMKIIWSLRIVIVLFLIIMFIYTFYPE